MLRIISISAAFFTLAFIPATGLIISVPDDQPTIQAGIDAAQSGDTVEVYRGTFTGDGNRDINFSGKNIVLKAWSHYNWTIINCGGTPEEPHVGIIFENGEDSSATVDRIRIINAWSENQGAIHISGASPTFKDCEIVNNDCDGIYVYPLSSGIVRVENCIISENSGHGYRATGADSRIANCWIENNGLNGVSIEWSGNLDLSYTLIEGNDGWGVYGCTMYDDFLIRNCTIIKNNSGLIWLANFPKEATGTDDRRYEIFDVAYNIIAFNDSVGIRAEYDYNEQTDSITRCNDVYGNLDGDFVGIDNYAGDAWGNFSEDPLFCVDPWYGRRSISVLSPCAPDNNSCSVLIGAFGIICTRICGDTNMDEIVNILDIIYTIEYLYSGNSGPVSGDWDVNNSGGINILDITYLIHYLYQGGPEPSCPELDISGG
jgi:hypothetical protein